MTDLTAKYYNQLPQAQGGMMPQHTPGPWRIGQLDALGGIPIVAPTPAYIVATVYVTEDVNEQANARLIEAAPELLAACLSCVAVLHPLLGETGPCAEAWAKARAAILKACPEGL